MTLTASLELFSREQAETVVGEACRVLATVGLLVEDAQGQALLLEAGAERRGARLHLPESAVRRALASAPARVALHERDGRLACDLGERRVHFDPGSAALHVLDAPSGRRRTASRADAVRLARLVDGLPHYAAQSTALTLGDVPEPLADRYRLYLALRHGRKPVVTGTFRVDGFAPMLAMLQAVRGGARALRGQPLALFDCCPSSPLRWSELTCRALVDCARAGVPANLISVPLTGATAPVTLREAVVQHCAENLSGVVLHQQAAAGAPLVWGGAPAAFDMRRGTAVMSAPESLLIDVANAQIGRQLGLPTHAYMALSDAKTPDYQAGLESGLGAALGALAGVNLVSGPGLLDFLLTQSLEKLLLDHEACGLALRLQRGIERREGDAVALLGDLARLGQFLGHAHTRQHWRAELTQPGPLIDRESYADWLATGARSALERAEAEVERRLAPAEPSPLPDALARELRGVLAAEAARLGCDLPAQE